MSNLQVHPNQELYTRGQKLIRNKLLSKIGISVRHVGHETQLILLDVEDLYR